MFHVPCSMSIFDFLKRKKQAEKEKEGKKIEKKVEKEPAETSVVPAVKQSRTHDARDRGRGIGTKEKKEETITAQKPAPRPKKNIKFFYEAVKQPHISEKATYLAERNQYIFKVLSSYNKNEIKKSVEGIYGVDVLSVNKIKIPAKKRRIGKTEGFRKGYVKAIVKIKEGQKIEIL